jgi:hypothetical protein
MNYACRTLDRAYLRCDNEHRPMDLIKGGAVLELADMINEHMESLECD